MPTISIFFGIVIQMFWNEHGVPHFHARYGDESASIDIRSLEVLEGKLSRRTLNLVLEWAKLHRNELLENWELCGQKLPPKKIAPLE